MISDEKKLYVQRREVIITTFISGMGTESHIKKAWGQIFLFFLFQSMP